MKIYTLTVVYSPETDEVYEIEESLDDESVHHKIYGVDINEVIEEEKLLWRIQMGSGEVALS